MPAKNKRVIMYVDYPTKMKIGKYMQQNGIIGYSNFLRLATFFLINNDNKLTKHTIWDENRKVLTKVSITDDPKHKDHLNVINELKNLFKSGEQLLKKIE